MDGRVCVIFLSVCVGGSLVLACEHSNMLSVIKPTG